MQRLQRVVGAGLFEHPGGTELRVYFEPKERVDLLQSDIQRVVPPFIYLKNVLFRVATHPQRLVHQLTPKGWAAALWPRAAA